MKGSASMERKALEGGKPAVGTTLRRALYGQAICEALLALRRNASVEEVFLAARALGHPVSFATTYSTLVELAREGLVLRLTVNHRRRQLYALRPDALPALVDAGLLAAQATRA